MRVCLILLLSCLTNVLIAQVVGGVQSKGMDMNAQAYGFVKEIRAEPKEIKGNLYLNQDWMIGQVKFINNVTIQDKAIRYNIKSNSFEIKLDGVVKGIDGRNVLGFEVMNRTSLEKESYVVASKYKLNDVELTGFLQILSSNGEYNLFSKTHVELVQGMYVAALDMGEDEDAYVKKVKYYIGKNGKLMDFSANRKKFAKLFPGKENEILEFIKSESISLKDGNDLISIIEFINRLNV